MEVFIEKNNQTKQLKADNIKTAADLLKNLKINSSEVLIIKNDEVILVEDEIKDSDSIKILSVISGG